MRKFFLAVLVVLVAMIAAVLVGPGFVDWNDQKGRLVAEFERLTGRRLTIAGDIDLALLPAPTLSAERVSLANIAGGSEPDMAKVKELALRVALMPLLQGDIRVESLSLIEPEVLLEVLPDGRRNWDLDAAPITGETTGPTEAPAAAEAQTSDDGSRSLAAQVRLNDVQLRNGRVIYRDALGEERIEDLDADITAVSLRGPFSIEGSAGVSGLKLGFDVNLGRLLDSGASGLNLRLALPGADAALGFSGSLSNHPDNISLRGKLDFSGQSALAAANALLGTTATSWRVPPLSFQLESEIFADLERLQTEALELKLGELSLTGELEARYGDRPDIRLALAAKRLDIDQLLTLAERSPASPVAPRTASKASAGTGADNGQRERTKASGATAQDAAVSAFALPRGVTASLELVADTLIYNRQVVRQLLVNATLADGELEVGQAIALLPGGSDISLTGRLTTADGRPHLAASAEGASDNLRSLLSWLEVDLPEVPATRLRRATFGASVSATPQQITISNLDLRVDVTRLTGGLVMALRTRPAFGIGLQVDKLNLDAYLPPERTEGTEPKSKDPVAQQSVTGQSVDTAPASTEQAGTKAGDTQLLAVLGDFDANLDLRAGSVVYQGHELGDLLLDATLQRGSLAVRKAQVADFEGAHLAYQGAVDDLAGEISLDGRYDFATEDFGRLLRALEGDLLDDPNARALAMSGTVKGSLQTLGTETKLEVLGGSAQISGTLSPASGDFDLGLSVRHAEARGLLNALGASLTRGALPGDLGLDGRARGTLDNFVIEGLKGNVGDIEGSGRIGLDRRGGRPLVTLDLDTGAIPLARLVDAQGGGGGGLAANLSRRWSREPVDVTALREFDADVELRAQALSLDGPDVKTPRLEASLRNAVLEVKKLNGTVYGGALILSGKVDLQQRPDVALALTAIEMNLAHLLAEMGLAERVSGPLTVNARLDSRGASEAELVSNLAGSGELQGSININLNEEEQLGGAALGLLGDKVKKIQGIADATTTLLGAFTGAPAGLTGSFVVEDGILRTEDTRAAGRNATALTKATIDLPGWRLDSRTDVYRAGDQATPYLTANLRGPLDKPNVKISGQPFQRQEGAAD